MNPFIPVKRSNFIAIKYNRKINEITTYYLKKYNIYIALRLIKIAKPKWLPINKKKV